MRKAIAGVLLGAVALGCAANAVAATALPRVPAKPVAFGQLNNRAVLGLTAAQQEGECRPDENGNGCGLSEQEVGGGGNSALPIVGGVVAAGAIVGAAASGGSSSSP
jgi:hypothetical protein